ncbi:sulfotransferase family protein [Sinobacterium caligoides]|uniref:Sulfotransferase family protein n=1 Tax=Sinobacterium caligoides TaxID=933926 RepID=A0A3N2E0V1_9GAMM|nr:sulfotransferase [Sinobacterium caligoides]ROS05753.1 sulfotransferase family protein [Sinobacterium caligoides]
MTARIDFSFDSVVAEAKQRAGLDNFGDYSFEAPLRVLLHALEVEAKLSELGREMQHERVVNALVNRLQLQDFCQRYPEILDEQIAAPVVIVGLPRTGTTMLQRTMACDERFYSPLWYEIHYPAPARDWDFTTENDARIPQAELDVEAILEVSPGLAAIHPLEAGAADEEIILLEHSFFSTTPEAFCNIPGYGDWLSEADNTPGYQYLRRQLQFLQWQKKKSGVNPNAERWLLKSPHHLHHMQTLLEVFPGTKVVQTHRDPLQTIPSICSFNSTLWAMNSEAVDDQEIARQWSDKFARGMRHTMAVRAQYPEAFLDLWFDQTTTDAQGCARAIYEFVGMQASESALEKMRQWRQANKREDRAPHHYTLQQFGLTEQGLSEQFNDYRQAFIVNR